MVQIEPHMCSDEPRRAVTIPETARLLSVSVRTIYNMLDDNRLRSVSIGRRRLVLIDSIDEFIAAAGS